MPALAALAAAPLLLSGTGAQAASVGDLRFTPPQAGPVAINFSGVTTERNSAMSTCNAGNSRGGASIGPGNGKLPEPE